MELADTSSPAVTQQTGRQTIVVPGGKTLKIETSPDGVEILNEEVPAGKTWTVKFNLEIVET